MVKKDLSEQDLLIKAQNYCSLAEHCAAEVKEKLYQWGAEPKVQEQILNTLTDLDFINESRYAAAFVHDKVAFQGWGREKIRMMLVMKHIASPVIEEAILNIDEEVYNKQLTHLIEQKKQEIPDSQLPNDPASFHLPLSTLNYKAKIARFLSQRGFTTDEIMQKI